MKYYFLGIGGIGMSALARFFNQRGDTVYGYDRTESPLTQQLATEGITIHYDDDPVKIPADIDIAIYTPAVPQDTAEFQHLLHSGVKMEKRSQMLGELTRGKKCIAVAGTHGKTTTSSMIAHLLNQSSLGCSAFLGGIAKNFGSNMVVNNKSEYVVVEADEYDRSFLQLYPYFSVITATDPDHLDIYGTYAKLLKAFRQFAGQTDAQGKLFVKEGLFGTGHHHDEDEHVQSTACSCTNHDCTTHDCANCGEACGGETLQGPIHSLEGNNDDVSLPENINTFTYSARSISPDYYAINVRNYSGNIFFDLRTPDKVLYDIALTNSCLYNVENAVAAAAVALACGLTETELRQGLKTFAGISRRFDYRIHEKEIVYIDDYAHHPQEISATLESVKYLFPNKRVVGIFQPHLYSRTADFAEGFAQALMPLDEIILMDIYPAREKPIPGVTSHIILNKINKMEKYLCSREQVLELIPALYPDVVVTMGAGDIDRLVPELEQVLRDNFLNS